ncbi:MAG: hypothetical protein IJC48_03155 [Clostridia bacterium]|nr:hypothetical protein [Clostridia bacterium]
MLQTNKRFSLRLLCSLLACILLFQTALCEIDLIDDKDIVVDTANYKTCTVALSDYKKSGTVSAAEHYPSLLNVRYEGANARFVEFNVRRGEEVKKGDVLVTLAIDRDEVLIYEREMALARLKEDYAKNVSLREEEISEKMRDINAEENPYTREIRRLECEKLRLSLEKYRFETENAINDMTASLEELYQSYENQYLYAPMDGVVSDYTYLRENEIVTNGRVLMQLYDPTEMLFIVTNEKGSFRYNMPVTVEVGPGKTRTTGYGRVIACKNALPGESGSNNAFILIESYEGGKTPKNFTRPVVKFDEVYLEDVFVVDKDAVSLYGGRYFVYKLSENGMVSKRYVNHVAGTNQTGSFLLDGVEIGEKLILDS